MNPRKSLKINDAFFGIKYKIADVFYETEGRVE